MYVCMYACMHVNLVHVLNGEQCFNNTVERIIITCFLGSQNFKLRVNDTWEHKFKTLIVKQRNTV